MSKNKKIAEDRIAKVKCPHCDEMIYLYRTGTGRIIGITLGAATGATLGSVIGSSRGLASGGGAIAATNCVGLGGLLLGMGCGYSIGSAADKPQCPSCEETVRLGV